MKKIWCNGCFDLLHEGHKELLKHAKSLGDYLCVAIDSDERVTEMKGKGRPIWHTFERGMSLHQLPYVDEVKIFSTDKELEDKIKEYAPDKIVVGSDYKNKKIIGSQYAKEVVFFERIEGISTTSIIDKL